MLKTTFDVAVDISAPAEIVWAVMSDVERWPEWTASVSSVRLLDKRKLEIGARALIRQPKLLPAVWTVMAIETGRSFVWKSGLPGMWVYGRHSVEAAPGGAHVTLGLRYEGAFGWLLARMTRKVSERYLDIEAAGLKRQSELKSGPM